MKKQPELIFKIKMIRALNINLLLALISTKAYHSAVELNTRKCKLTHSGIEYRGNVFTTKSKSLCRPWDSIGTESDVDFADGSRVLAKNYCRNPNGTRKDLWCYVYKTDSPVELCAVPLCNSKKCRLTGPGVEYGGNANVTKSGYACSRWSDAAGDAVPDSGFPDSDRAAAANRCRNPTGDPGGPWCYASVDGATVPDYCETPDCDRTQDGCGWTLVNGAGHSSGPDLAWWRHGHYSTTAFPGDVDDDDDDGGSRDGHVSFELKAWDPAAAVASARGGPRPFRLSLTAYPTGAGAADAIDVPVPADAFADATRAVLMQLSWRNGYVALTAGHQAKEVAGFELKNVTLSPVAYVSFVGGDPAAVPVAVRFPRCNDQQRTAAACEQHVTNNRHAYRIFPIKKTVVSTSELLFSVRTVISASVTYYTAPAKKTPHLVITFEARPIQQIKITYQEQSTSEEQLIFHQPFEEDIISYWKWHQYSITIVDKTLLIQITNEHQNNPTTIVNVTDYKLRFFHWFAIGSNTIAHWTLYCSGSEYYPLPKAVLPECVVSESGENYIGTQWITGDGEPCVPWNASSVRKVVKEKALIDGSYANAKNYCRNPTKDKGGPYCFIAVNGNDSGGDNLETVEKRSCHIRKCQNTRCRVTGIATDYMGTLNKTVSNRTCLKWSAAAKNDRKNHVFPDKTASAAVGYCRNPTGDPTGAWCYVGGAAETDSCDVPSCPDDGGDDDSDTLLTGAGVHWMYLLPEWRNAPGMRTRLKLWAPGVPGGVSLRFRPAGAPPSSYDLLRVGANGGENIRLFRVRDGVENGPAADELAYPHLLMASRWTELAFEFTDDDDHHHNGPAVTMSSAAGGVIFRWQAAANDHPHGNGGRYALVGLSAEQDGGGFVGARFRAEDCLVHSSESENFTVYLPINVRTNTSLTNVKNEIVFRMKHTGTTRIALIKRSLSEFYLLEIEGGRVVLSSEEGPTEKTLIGTYESKTGDIIRADSWKSIYLSWNESELRLSAGARWTVTRPLLVRHFSVANRGGRTAWTANCDERQPADDDDGPPRDGGWGEWGDWERCTKTCGGGTGVRRRRCDRPRPNMSGRPCAGPAVAVGECNAHRCGQVSARTVAAARRRLADGSHNVAAAVGDRLTMSCDQPTVDAVRADSPGAAFAWLHNGKRVRRQPTSTDEGASCTLVINSSTTQNSGIYTFVALPPEFERVVLKVFAVSIYDKSISVYIEDTVQVRCNAVMLGYLFDGLLQEWLVNDTYVIKSYGVDSLASIDIDIITIENANFQGVWKCVVKNTETNNTWITSMMEIKGILNNFSNNNKLDMFYEVMGKSTAWTRIMQDPIMKITFHNSSSTTIVLICSVLILSLCISTWGCACVFKRWHKQLLRKESKKISYRLM